MVLEGRQSRWFLAKIGGFPLSPLLYTIYVMDMMKLSILHTLPSTSSLHRESTDFLII